jgi:hypothetical protein
VITKKEDIIMTTLKSAAKLLCGALVIVSLSLPGAFASGMKGKLHGPMVILIDKNGVISSWKTTTKVVGIIQKLIRRPELNQGRGAKRPGAKKVG